ncbi:hypothetical protein J1N35_005825 [Gossypium stocksii]|uniref:Uncharacterized protein n=1 Tax=Gossypium stocksii TaxID=47602 RepID=A0A9D3WG22_9ROSI|nr:hypothetical protein J1N35_005825 [Gossypium stocksii]
MSRKRTRSFKTTTENLIVIQDKEVKERFDSIFKNQPMMLEKGFNLEIKAKANLKGPYVQGYIITHDLEILVENVHELNPTEPSEPTEPETDESLNKSETEATSVTETEEAGSEEEPNNLESIKELKISKPSEESNVDEPIEPSVDLELTFLMPTSSNTMEKSKLSIMGS